MELSNKSIVDIRDFLDSQKVEGCNLSAIPEIIEILDADENFEFTLASQKVESDKHAFEYNGIIYYSDNLVSTIDKRVADYRKIFACNEIDLYNFMLLKILLHEVAHVNQKTIALNSRDSKYPSISTMYYMLFFDGIIDKNHYKSNRFQYVFEYNADMEASRLLRKIFLHKFALATLNNALLRRYLQDYYRDGMFISERTFDAEGIQYDAIEPIGDIPTGLAIMHGLPVSDRVVREIQGAPISLTRRKYDL